MHTWKVLSFDQPFLFIFRYFGDPKYVIILKAGHHLLNYISQFINIVVGTITKCGPQIPFYMAKCANNPIV